jgi:hypothetical protein
LAVGEVKPKPKKSGGLPVFGGSSLTYGQALAK